MSSLTGGNYQNKGKVNELFSYKMHSIRVLK